MPDQDPVPGHSERLLRGLIWAGVVLAPMAAIVVLLGSSTGSVRFAVLLVVISVVLIGTSVLLRNDPRLYRRDVENRVAEEVTSLRRELRSEFARGGPVPSRPLPPPGESDFFGAAPVHPDEDPFAPHDHFPVPSAPLPPGAPTAGPAPIGPAPVGSASVGSASVGSASVSPVRPTAPGRASIPPATAAVRPVPAQRGPARREPGLTTGERAAMLPAEPGPGLSTGGRAPGLPPAQHAGAGARREPGHTTGGRVVASAAAAVPQRGAVTARPGTQYGRPESLAGDFGASDGYAEAVSHDGAAGQDGTGFTESGYDGTGYHDAGGYDVAGPVHAPAYDEAGGYQQAGGHAEADDYDDGGYTAVPPDSGAVAGKTYGTTYGGNGTTYGSGGATYGSGAEDFPDADSYRLAGGYDEPVEEGDPTYRARRHRPSANDTNVGTLAEFAEYSGYEEPDERYVRGYPGRR